MQTITDRTEELARELSIRTWVALTGAGRAVAERARDQRGQTAAEYMGLLFVIALIIGALISIGVHTTISKAANGLIEEISKGGKEGK
jgi:Flp pilus assembly pilin Flp